MHTKPYYPRGRDTHRSIVFCSPDLTNRIITGKLDYLDMLLFPVYSLLVWITTLHRSESWMPNEWNSYPAVAQSTAQPLRRTYITAMLDKSCKRKSLCTSATIANGFILHRYLPSPHIIYIQLVERDVFAVAAFQKHLPDLNKHTHNICGSILVLFSH